MRNDLNRLGLFSELGYISIGDPYYPPNSSKFIFIDCNFTLGGDTFMVNENGLARPASE